MLTTAHLAYLSHIRHIVCVVQNAYVRMHSLCWFPKVKILITFTDLKLLLGFELILTCLRESFSSLTANSIMSYGSDVTMVVSDETWKTETELIVAYFKIIPLHLSRHVFSQHTGVRNLNLANTKPKCYRPSWADYLAKSILSADSMHQCSLRRW